MTEQPHIHVGVTKKLPDGKGGYTEITINVSRVSPSTNFEPAILTARDLAHEIMAEVEAKFDGEVRAVPVGYLGRRTEPFTATPKIDPGAFGVSAAVPLVDGDKQQAAGVADDIAAKGDPETTEPPTEDEFAKHFPMLAALEREKTATPEPDKTTDLMQALQASLDKAKADAAAKLAPKPELAIGLNVKRTDRPENFVVTAIEPKGVRVKNLEDPFEDEQVVDASVIVAGVVEGDKSGPKASSVSGADATSPPTQTAPVAAFSAGPTEDESDAAIPDPINVATHYEAFGVTGLTVPPLEDWNQPYTKTGGDSGGGQCKAVNTALSESGFGGKLRHRAAQALLEEFGIQRGEIDTLDQLSKAEASLILEWFDKAGAEALAALSLAMGQKVAA